MGASTFRGVCMCENQRVADTESGCGGGGGGSGGGGGGGGIGELIYVGNVTAIDYILEKANTSARWPEGSCPLFLYTTVGEEVG